MLSGRIEIRETGVSERNAAVELQPLEGRISRVDFEPLTLARPPGRGLTRFRVIDELGFELHLEQSHRCREAGDWIGAHANFESPGRRQEVAAARNAAEIVAVEPFPGADVKLVIVERCKYETAFRL